MAELRQPADPFTAFRFRVSVDGETSPTASSPGAETTSPLVLIAGFSDVSGLAVETEVETLREGGVNTHEWQLAGATKFPSRLVLKRGMADKKHLWNWYSQIISGAIYRRDIRIDVLSCDGSQSLAWTFVKACPVKWIGPELHAGTSAVAFESIELIHQGLLPDRVA